MYASIYLRPSLFKVISTKRHQFSVAFLHFNCALLNHPMFFPCLKLEFDLQTTFSKTGAACWSFPHGVVCLAMWAAAGGCDGWGEGLSQSLLVTLSQSKWYHNPGQGETCFRVRKATWLISTTPPHSSTAFLFLRRTLHLITEISRRVRSHFDFAHNSQGMGRA